ncbi:hypothetical protein PDL04_26700 [Bacillus cereus group sp. BY142LC]|uniref:hypothetical protein n=1 Tax=Bacillus cereus group sp. BY142LC TaxID=3018083 RepID=UPI0022E854A8|nr:hypothetical protein [Bacillus cereus group sp. BY142LC]MDA1835041.1 hypothetical protein [Bacillus cereus group sp. BY142LC]
MAEMNRIDYVREMNPYVAKEYYTEENLKNIDLVISLLNKEYEILASKRDELQDILVFTDEGFKEQPRGKGWGYLNIYRLDAQRTADTIQEFIEMKAEVKEAIAYIRVAIPKEFEK